MSEYFTLLINGEIKEVSWLQKKQKKTIKNLLMLRISISFY